MEVQRDCAHSNTETLDTPGTARRGRSQLRVKLCYPHMPVLRDMTLF